jgi:hypothetical protein
VTSISAGHYHGHAGGHTHKTAGVGHGEKRGHSAHGPREAARSPEQAHYDKHHRKHHAHGADHARGAHLYHKAAAHKLGAHAQPSISVSASVAYFTNDPVEAGEVAQNLLQTISGLLSQSDGDPQLVSAEIADSLSAARTEAEALTANEAEAEGVAETAELVEQGLESATEAEAQNLIEADGLVALNATRDQAYSLKIRTQEGDLVKISLRTSEALQIEQAAAGDTAEDGAASPTQDIALGVGAQLNLRVYGDLNDTELAAIQGVFEQAADIAQEFFDGDLAAAFESSQAIEFDAAQIAKIRLHFRSQTSVSALYNQPAPAAVEPPEPTGEPAVDTVQSEQTSQPFASQPGALQPADQTDEAPATDPADASTEAATASQDTAATELNNLADAIADYFRSFVEGLEALQFNSSDDEESGYRLVTAFKLDVLKATIVASAGEGQEAAAEQAAEAIEEAAVSEAA